MKDYLVIIVLVTAGTVHFASEATQGFQLGSSPLRGSPTYLDADCSECEGVIPGDAEGPYHSNPCWEQIVSTCHVRPGGPQEETEAIGNWSNWGVHGTTSWACNSNCTEANCVDVTYTASASSQLCVIVSQEIGMGLKALGYELSAKVGNKVQMCKSNSESSSLAENVCCDKDERKEIFVERRSQAIRITLYVPQNTYQIYRFQVDPECGYGGDQPPEDITLDGDCPRVEAVSEGYRYQYRFKKVVSACVPPNFTDRYMRQKPGA